VLHALCAVFRVMIVAKKFAAPGWRRMHFAVSDADEMKAELKHLSLSYVNDTPVVVARDLSERRYVMHQLLTYVHRHCIHSSAVSRNIL